jgi:hypothetical protein
VASPARTQVVSCDLWLAGILMSWRRAASQSGGILLSPIEQDVTLAGVLSYRWLASTALLLNSRGARYGVVVAT